MRNLKLGIYALIVMLCFSQNAEAQFMKNLGKALKGESQSSSKTSTEPEKLKVERNEWSKSNAGKVIFYNKFLERQKADSDSESGMLTSGVIGANSPTYFRAYLDKPYKEACPDCDNLEIRYTMGGVSITTQDLRNDLAAYYARMASTISFYDSKNLAVGVALNADKGRYFDNYTLQEDAYRILLSKISSKLTKDASLTLKVEIMGLKGTSADATVLASGELPMKVTDESYNIQNLNCRCGKAGMTDAAIIKEVKEAFEFQFNDIKEVYKVVLLDRDFTMNYDNSYPTKLVTSKGMWANIVYKNDKDIYMMVKRYIFFKKDGAGFSSKATIGKHKFYLPVSPTCSK